MGRSGETHKTNVRVYQQEWTLLDQIVDRVADGKFLVVIWCPDAM